MDTLENVEVTASIRHIVRFKIRNTDLQFKSPKYRWQTTTRRRTQAIAKRFAL